MVGEPSAASSDVLRVVGVSRTTASLVRNGRGGRSASVESCWRVRVAAVQRGYRPNRLAGERTLHSRISGVRSPRVRLPVGCFAGPEPGLGAGLSPAGH